MAHYGVIPAVEGVSGLGGGGDPDLSIWRILVGTDSRSRYDTGGG